MGDSTYWNMVQEQYQAVRELVEQTFPHRRVIRIQQRGGITYKRKPGSLDQESAEFLPAQANIGFDVETTTLAFSEPVVHCEVALDATGTLQIVSQNCYYVLH